MKNTEQHNLDNIAEKTLYGYGANEAMVRYSFHIVKRYLKGNTVLELGPAEGIMTELLASTGKELTLVEGAEGFCKKLSQKYPKATVYNSLFENYKPEKGQLFDNIILGHVLEHVQDPVSILAQVRNWLAPGGMVFAAVPNSRSLHRQAAVIMGLLPFEEGLNEMDVHHGHRRVFNPETFRQVFNDAHLKIGIFGGYWLKPVSNGQIEQSWDDKMLAAFMLLGERYPDIAGEIYIVASND